MISEKIKKIVKDWTWNLSYRVNELGKFIEEENILMFKKTIIKCKDLLKELDEDFTNYIRIGIRGGLGE